MSGRLAVITGLFGLLALVLLILFFMIGDPFGTLNDLCNGITGVLSGLLAWNLFNKFHTERIFFIFALIGALVVVIGSVLVIYEITGWYLAGLFTSVGYALIGLWVAALNYSVRQLNLWSQRLVKFGLISGLIMALGLLAIPAIINRIDAWEMGPWYVNYVGLLGSLGELLLYPLWCILAGRVLLLTQNQRRGTMSW